MRIPVVLAEHNVPEAIPYGRGESPVIAGEMAGRPYEIAGKALGQVGDTLARLERAKYEQGVKIESAALQSHMELAAETALQSRKLTETDPDAYRIGAGQDIQDAYKAALGQAKYPETKALLAQHLQHVLSTKGVEVMKWSNELYKSRNLGLLDTGLDDIKMLGARAPDQPAIMGGEEPGTAIAVRGRADYFNEGKAAIISATPLLGELGTQDKLIKWRQDFGDAMARADLRVAPETDVSRYANVLGPEKYDRLLAHKETLLRAADALSERELKRIEKAAEADRQAALVQLDVKAREKTLTADDIEAAVLARTIKTPAEHKHVYDMMNATDKPSDPDVLRRLSANVHSKKPNVTDDQIRRSMDEWAAGRPGLNITDGTALQDRLRQQEQRIDDKAHTMQGERYRAAKEQGYKRLGLTTPFDQLDPLAKKLVADFDAEFNARTDYLNDKGQDSFAVLNEILPRFVEAQRQQARLDYGAQNKLIDPSVQAGPAPEPMDAKWQDWYARTAQNVERLRTSDPNLYATQRAQLKNLLDAHGRVVDNAIRNQGAAGPSSLGRGPATPTAPRPTQ